MFIHQFYTSCIAEAAYYIESEGKAAIIDPLRDVDQYIEFANGRGAEIIYIFETHFHADFVSGHLDLQQKTGAKIIYGPKAETGFKSYTAKDGEIFELGNIALKVLHTPGHTPESSCFLLLDSNKKPHALFSGDTVFVGDVGRPDLAVKGNLTVNDLAGMMYDSLQTKILPLNDDVILYPGHGAGSSCGKNIGKETFSTIGQQRKFNYALQNMSKENFIESLTNGLSAPPSYFFTDAKINKSGYDSLDHILSKNLKSLTLAEFIAEKEKGTLILDSRFEETFAKEFIPGSLNISLTGQFALWVGNLIDINQPLLLVTEPGKESETVVRLARVGYENIVGILAGGLTIWKNANLPVDSIPTITPEEFVTLQDSGNHVLDVRNKGEWENGVVENAQLICLTELPVRWKEVDKNQKTFLHCGGGYRSMMAASLLKKHGYHNMINVLGGMTKMKSAGVKLVQLQESK